MKRKNRRDHTEHSRIRIHPREDPENKSNGGADWPGEHRRYISIVGILLIALCTVIIYSQTILVPPIDYEDPFYLVHSPYVRVSAPFSRLGSVWDEPYFATFLRLPQLVGSLIDPWRTRMDPLMRCLSALLNCSMRCWGRRCSLPCMSDLVFPRR
jgi:hypothetical protein